MSNLTVWRLCAAKYAATAFSGEGAEYYGGRWSPAGIRIAYCAESRALAVLETIANAEERDRLLAREWIFICADVPGELIVKPGRLPQGWRQYPHPPETQTYGAEWVQSRGSGALRVPSAVVLGEFNYLLNPAHPDFKRVKIGKSEPFSFDPRLA